MFGQIKTTVWQFYFTVKTLRYLFCLIDEKNGGN